MEQIGLILIKTLIQLKVYTGLVYRNSSSNHKNSIGFKYLFLLQT